MKKLILTLLLLLTIITTACSPYRASADVNNDGHVDITDYSLIRLHILEIKPLENTERGDVNNDGIINAEDQKIIGSIVQDM